MDVASAGTLSRCPPTRHHRDPRQGRGHQLESVHQERERQHPRACKADGGGRGHNRVLMRTDVARCPREGGGEGDARGDEHGGRRIDRQPERTCGKPEEEPVAQPEDDGHHERGHQDPPVPDRAEPVAEVAQAHPERRADAKRNQAREPPGTAGTHVRIKAGRADHEQPDQDAHADDPGNHAEDVEGAGRREHDRHQRGNDGQDRAVNSVLQHERSRRTVEKLMRWFWETR